MGVFPLGNMLFYLSFFGYEWGEWSEGDCLNKGGG
jgi:hypothetical protein